MNDSIFPSSCSSSQRLPGLTKAARGTDRGPQWAPGGRPNLAWGLHFRDNRDERGNQEGSGQFVTAFINTREWLLITLRKFN